MRTFIFKEIDTEREVQTEKWGNTDGLNTPHHWGSYICQYATRHLIGNPQVSPDAKAFRDDMVKVAALAVAAIESMDVH